MITPIITILLLCSPLGLAAIISKLRNKPLDIKKYAFWGLSIAFLFFSLGHFAKTQGMVEMLPTWVPFRLNIIYLTGIMEILIAITLFIPKYQSVAAKAALIVFILFFPANIYSALNSIGLGGHQWGPIYLLIRGPLQLLLIGWTYFLCIRGNNQVNFAV
ncbi:DoxX family protein [Zooshikella sp. RANM57]|uniref:DoxX family protein n=1 Tax=Zooshikella sp. RANM57 TaxID=3425863 RepID=UPI003D6E0E9B